ncbi:6-hydroxymethyl-7,8-dihydropterin pyrophosphokinase [Candidatus Methanoplasma termitum]|uniref:6-hydroxymethyl-7,8-dihydropterin pyrophosphokinase n=2 Tax=Candidatus Methanoplasma termitum TaxID=1577791 RepID=A0A0A7LDG0_9ARCH|nr:6-hydroxymethyl-7,8-dihydropterin pyrophosphokinase [Candidatus Methanoplasma termitum]
MLPEEWERIYEDILYDFGYSRTEDESSARLLKAVMMNSDLIFDDDIKVQRKATVFGCSDDLENEIEKDPPKGTLIASGSAVGRLKDIGIMPDIVVTDLDGDIMPQIEASKAGAVTFMHAHGDNSELIQRYAHSFIGPVVLTTQSRPDNILSNYGGFTDGDRAVCIARHFGAKDILLLGFDFERPSEKAGTDSGVKAKKLLWAKKIIFDHNEPGVSVRRPSGTFYNKK